MYSYEKSNNVEAMRVSLLVIISGHKFIMWCVMFSSFSVLRIEDIGDIVKVRIMNIELEDIFKFIGTDYERPYI